VASYTPAAVRESPEWSAIVNDTEENRASVCKALNGKTLFSVLYGTYTVTVSDLKATLKVSNTAGQSTAPKSAGPPSAWEDGFQEVWRRKWQSTKETARTSKKAVLTAASATINNPPSKEVATRNFFTPFRSMATDMDTVIRYRGQSTRRGSS
jgi:hypothetical protein